MNHEPCRLGVYKSFWGISLCYGAFKWDYAYLSICLSFLGAFKVTSVWQSYSWLMELLFFSNHSTFVCLGVMLKIQDARLQR